MDKKFQPLFKDKQYVPTLFDKSDIITSNDERPSDIITSNDERPKVLRMIR